MGSAGFSGSRAVPSAELLSESESELSSTGVEHSSNGFLVLQSRLIAYLDFSNPRYFLERDFYL